MDLSSFMQILLFIGEIRIVHPFPVASPCSAKCFFFGVQNQSLPLINFQVWPAKKKSARAKARKIVKSAREKSVLYVQILVNLHPCNSKKCTCKFLVTYTRANQKVPVQLYVPFLLKLHLYHDFWPYSEGGGDSVIKGLSVVCRVFLNC